MQGFVEKCVTSPPKGISSNYWGKRPVCIYFVSGKHVVLFACCVPNRSNNCPANVISIHFKGRAIVLKEVKGHWSDNLIPSPSKKDVVFQHIKGPGLHSFVEQANSVVKYVCAPEAECKSHQRHFMENTTTALYKHFLQLYPFCRVSVIATFVC